jgi:hypothetical protein
MIPRSSYTNGRDSLTSHQVCETGNGHNQKLDFTKWTMAHGHFALMGGFTIGVPLTTDDGLFLDESQDSREVVSLRPQQLFALFEKEVHSQARFDLFTHISEAQIKQFHEYYSIQHMFVLLRLLTFVWYCYQRQRLGLETSPLEVVTVGHVFMAVLIEIFWWDKPPYLRLPVQNLDRQALCQAIPGLERELYGLAAAREKKTVDAYTSSPDFRIIQWSPSQDIVVGLKYHTNYRVLIVFGLCTCHSAILMMRSVFRLSFPTPNESDIWDMCSACLGGFGLILFVNAALDLPAQHISEKFPKFMKFMKFMKRHGVILESTPAKDARDRAFGEPFNLVVQWVGAALLMWHTSLVLVAAINFRQASEGIYAVGPGDISKFDVVISWKASEEYGRSTTGV